MGILDDAIREHLDLIRSHGAADSEVQRLEDEAFGPPTRPDEADFPESEDAQASGNGVATEAPVDEGGGEEVVHEDVTTLMPADEAAAQAGDVEEPAAEVLEEEPEAAVEDLAVEPVEEAGAALEDVHDEEPAAEEHPVVDEVVPEADQPAAEEAPMPAEEGTSLYDHTRDEMDIDLDLQLEEEPPAAEPPAAEPPPDAAEQPAVEPPSEESVVAEPEGARPLEPPIESLDTVEHPFPEEIVEPEEPHDEAAPSDEYEVAEETAGVEEGAEHVEEGEEEDAEDVLADTPEFLKDAPEDDELWFEQGEPKDFDF